VRPDLNADLDAVVARMMAVDVADRYPTPDAVQRALLPFLTPPTREKRVLPALPLARATPAVNGAEPAPRAQRVLLVDDEPPNRFLFRQILQAEGMRCDEAGDGEEGLAAARANPYDLVVLDVDMPKLTGLEVLRRLREEPPVPHLKIMIVSGRVTNDEMARTLSLGADDYLEKPFSAVQFQARVKAVLRLKEAQDRSDLLTQHLLTSNHELERNLTARDSDLVHARNALVLALAELVNYRDIETGDHLTRMQRYSRCLAEAAAGSPSFASQVDEHFIGMLECCAPLHDIGKVGLPDHVLLKPGRLTPEERVMMQTHTTIGAAVLQKVANRHAFARAFLQMATEITRHHHERYDGKGYPDRLAGDQIPLAARIVAFGDVYDALRSRRVYKPALSHADTVRVMTEESEGQFDPALLHVFLRCLPQFEKLYREWSG
jgi:response regulator RpfG family c-di-GMP phosphodiesterase